MIELLLFQVFILAASLTGLASASHFAIKSIEEIIEITGLSEASAGFAILAVMTSIPEIIVAIFSVAEGTPGISVGDILGSNVFNIGVVIGILGTFGYIKTCCTELLVEMTDVLFLTTLIPLLLVISHFHIVNIASQIVGVILLGTFVINTYVMVRKRTPAVKVDSNEVTKKSKKLVAAKLLLTLSCVIITARLVVYSGLNIAILMGVAPILIGAKVVAIGTSLPELTLDLTAVRRGRIQLALGDIIGSNLTNITLVLGLVLLLSPFSVNTTILTEILPFLMITTIIFWRFLIKGGVSQVGGTILIMIYILFQAILV